MLEGEIQAMYMCKPGKLLPCSVYRMNMWCLFHAAIERAMAYIDTGELPWDMDLFDQNSQVSPDVSGIGISS